jgi:template-activating factor I
MVTDVDQIALTLTNEIFPEAIDYFLGNAGGDELDSDDEEDSDDDAEEIDLEKPRPKKQKSA